MYRNVASYYVFVHSLHLFMKLIGTVKMIQEALPEKYEMDEILEGLVE